MHGQPPCNSPRILQSVSTFLLLILALSQDSWARRTSSWHGMGVDHFDISTLSSGRPSRSMNQTIAASRLILRIDARVFHVASFISPNPHSELAEFRPSHLSAPMLLSMRALLISRYKHRPPIFGPRVSAAPRLSMRTLLDPRRD